MPLVRNSDAPWPKDSLNLAALEEWAIRRALIHADGEIAVAAKLLGVTYHHLYHRIKKLKAKEDAYASPSI